MEDSEGIDMISNLADDLLCDVLSLLPIKDAFTTTILSKRWTSLFRSFTSLHFDDESVQAETIHHEETLRHFRHFVNTVILSTKLIKTFHLKFRRRRSGFQRSIPIMEAFRYLET
ncbi:F-box/LRR-repeat protein [Trifolium pratense]|uniref:Uncharacterized protein n=2 Tax=Trifolium pratense TaxID=57577 RepID=A0ACB0K5Q3_TRIPR|nr:F-box/LRR-repeat protein [Trifolium pratense]CAJ2652669.1 unnamed protein product [Trifolium pratense]